VHTESHAKPATSAWQPMDRCPLTLSPMPPPGDSPPGGWTGSPVPSPGGQTGQPFCMSHSEASIGASGAKKDDGVGELQNERSLSPLRASPTPSYDTSVEASANVSFRAEVRRCAWAGWRCKGYETSPLTSSSGTTTATFHH
jgi:hypothetical protein